MKKRLEIHQLTPEHVSFLLQRLPARIYNSSEALVYEDQVPLAGYVLLEGEIIAETRGAIPQRVPINSMICTQELLNGIPLKQTITISPGSKVIILDKSSVLEILEEDIQFIEWKRPVSV